MTSQNGSEEGRARIGQTFEAMNLASGKVDETSCHSSPNPKIDDIATLMNTSPRAPRIKLIALSPGTIIRPSS